MVFTSERETPLSSFGCEKICKKILTQRIFSSAEGKLGSILSLEWLKISSVRGEYSIASSRKNMGKTKGNQ